LGLTSTLLLALTVLPAAGAEKIVLDGSSGMLPLAKALATAYQQQSSAPLVETGKGLGTGARLRALAEGTIQIALASHGIKPEDVQKGNLKVIEVETAKVMARGGDMAKGLVETPHAIGMTSMTVVEQSGGKVKALTLNGVAPTAENVRSGRYFLTREFYFVIKGEPTPSSKKFLDFVLSPDGDRVILANGAVPLR